MPVMELRGDHDSVQRPPAPAHVGVEEQTGHDLHDGQHSGELGAEAGGEEEHERRGDENAVEWMVAQPADPIEMHRRVVDGVEPPQERHLVAPAVGPVGDEVEQDDAEDERAHRTARSRRAGAGQARAATPG